MTSSDHVSVRAGTVARVGLAVVVLGALVSASDAEAQPARRRPGRETPATRDVLEVVRSDQTIVRHRLVSQMLPVRPAINACRGDSRAEPIHIVMRLGAGDADMVDTVRHGEERDEELERCVREALAEWRPNEAAGSGAVEVVMRREPVARASGTLLSVLGSTSTGAGLGTLLGGLRAPTFGQGAVGVGTSPRPTPRPVLGAVATVGPVGVRAAQRALGPIVTRVAAGCAPDAHALSTGARALVVRVVVMDGRTASAVIDSATARSFRVDQCVLSAIREMSWPAAIGGITTVTATIAFETREPTSRRGGTRRRSPAARPQPVPIIRPMPARPSPP